MTDTPEKHKPKWISAPGPTSTHHQSGDFPLIQMDTVHFANKHHAHLPVSLKSTDSLESATLIPVLDPHPSESTVALGYWLYRVHTIFCYIKDFSDHGSLTSSQLFLRFLVTDFLTAHGSATQEAGRLPPTSTTIFLLFLGLCLAFSLIGVRDHPCEIYNQNNQHHGPKILLSHCIDGWKCINLYSL